MPYEAICSVCETIIECDGYNTGYDINDNEDYYCEDCYDYMPKLNAKMENET